MQQRQMNQGELVVLKLEAAQRQLDAAIRMFFMDEDKLAILTVVAAATTVLRDITKKSRGRDSFEDGVADGFRGYARDIARGTLAAATEEELRRDQALWDCLVSLAERVSAIGVDASMEQLRQLCPIRFPDDGWKKDLHQGLTKIPNFLKHADNDPTGWINEKDASQALSANLAYPLVTYNH